MPGRTPPQRVNQRYRTRKDLISAAARLMKDGRKPSLDEVAEAARVSRATAYRYFPNVEGLLVEASFDIAVPDAAAVFADERSTDPEERIDKAEAAIAMVQEVCGDLSAPGAGIVFTLPVGRVVGLSPELE